MKRTMDLLRDHVFTVVLLIVLSFVLAFITTLTAALSGPMLAAFFSSDAQSLQPGQIFVIPFISIDSFLNPLAKVIQNYIVVSVIVVAFFKFALTTSVWFGWERLGEQVALKLRQNLVSSYIDSSSDAKSTSEQLGTLATTDIRMIKDFVIHFYGGIPREGLSSLFLILFMAYLDWQLFLILVTCILPLGFFLKKVGKKISRSTRYALKDFTELSEWIQLRLTGVETIKQLRTEQLEAQSMKLKNEESADRFLKAAYTKALSGPLSELFAIFALIVVLSYTIHAQKSGDSIMAFFASLAMLSQSLGKLTRYFNTQREAKAAWNRLSDFKSGLKSQPKLQWSHPTPPNVLQLNNVSIHHYDRPSPMFQKISFSCVPGQLTMIRGPSGVGKSTLFRCIIGTMEFNGQIQRITDNLGFIPQDCHLLPCSLGVNISYPDLRFDPQRARDSLVLAGLEPLSKHLTDEVGALSGGQKQRIHLARLFYHSPRLVLIDEGTSALDIDTERFFMENLKNWINKGSCVLMIAHRPSIIEFADQTIELKPMAPSTEKGE